MQKGNPNKTKHWFFKKINKIDRFYQARLIEEKKRQYRLPILGIKET